MLTQQLSLCQISIALWPSINQESHFTIIFILSINDIFWISFLQKIRCESNRREGKGTVKQWLSKTVVGLSDLSPTYFLCGCGADNSLFLCLQNLLPAHSCEFEPDEKWDMLRQTFQKEDSVSGSWLTCHSNGNSVTGLQLLHVPMCSHSQATCH